MLIPHRRGFRPSLALKITLPYAMLALVLALAVIYVVARIQAISITTVFNRQLDDARLRVADSLVRTEQSQLQDLRTIVHLSGLARAIQTGEQRRVVQLVAPYAASQRIERVLIFDVDGRGLANIQTSESSVLEIDASPVAGYPALTASLLQQLSDQWGDKYSALVDSGGEVVLYTSAPIYSADTRVGTLLVGTTATTLVEHWRATTLAEVTLYAADGKPLSTSLGDDALAPLDVVGMQAPLRHNLSLGSREYSEIVTPLVLRGSPTGQFVGVALSSIGRAEILDRSEVLLLSIFASGFGITALIGIALARRIAKPITALVQATDTIGAGDFSQALPVLSQDEIGVLTAAFNTMTTRLFQATQKISEAHRSIQKLNAELVQLTDELFETLARFFDARDPYVGGHAAKVADYATAIAQELGLPPDRIKCIRQAGFLHDIGKIAISEAILHKPSRLTTEEYEVLKTHVTIGAKLLEQSPGLRHLGPFVRYHHERWDGTGYPEGLCGEQIPLEARILNVCDSVEAMASDRPYHQGMTLDAVIAEVKCCAGSQFDPTIAAIFVALAEREGATFIINSAHEVSCEQTRTREAVYK